jgi:hypothetical protein
LNPWLHPFKISWPLAFPLCTHTTTRPGWRFFQIIKCFIHTGGTYVSLSSSQSWEIFFSLRRFRGCIAWMLAHTKLNRVQPLEPKNKLAHLLSSIFETQKTRTPLARIHLLYSVLFQNSLILPSLFSLSKHFYTTSTSRCSDLTNPARVVASRSQSKLTTRNSVWCVCVCVLFVFVCVFVCVRVYTCCRILLLHLPPPQCGCYLLLSRLPFYSIAATH